MPRLRLQLHPLIHGADLVAHVDLVFVVDECGAHVHETPAHAAVQQRVPLQTHQLSSALAQLWHGRGTAVAQPWRSRGAAVAQPWLTSLSRAVMSALRMRRRSQSCVSPEWTHRSSWSCKLIILAQRSRGGIYAHASKKGT